MTSPGPLGAEVEAFLAALSRTASPATLDAYRRDLSQLLAFLDAQEVSAWRQLDAGLVRRFLGGERARGLAPRSLARRRSACSRLWVPHGSTAVCRVPENSDAPVWDTTTRRLRSATSRLA